MFIKNKEKHTEEKNISLKDINFKQLREQQKKSFTRESTLTSIGLAF
jgi:hypothetical protein